MVNSNEEEHMTEDDTTSLSPVSSPATPESSYARESYHALNQNSSLTQDSISDTEQTIVLAPVTMNSYAEYDSIEPSTASGDHTHSHEEQRDDVAQDLANFPTHQITPVTESSDHLYTHLSDTTEKHPHDIKKKSETLSRKNLSSHHSEFPNLSEKRTSNSSFSNPRMIAAPRSRGPVRATMQIRRIDPWSTFKVGLLLSVVLFFIWMISVALLYLLLGVMGVWGKLNSNVGELLNNNNSASTELVSVWSIFGGAALIGLVNIVILTSLMTLGAIIYNVMTDLVGGIEITLADQD